jgi:hypothetical protein
MLHHFGGFMKILSVLLSVFFLVWVLSCNKNPTGTPSGSDENTQIKLGMKITSINSQCKETNVPLSKLCLKLSAEQAATIYDTLAITENEDYFWKYYGLKPFRKWNVNGIVIDSNDSISHSGSLDCYVDEWMDNFVLQMLPNYTQISALFFPLSSYPESYGEITRCELVIDNKDAGNKTNDSVSLGDTVSILYNYLRLGKEHTITLNVFGTFMRNPYLLFTGSITKQFDQFSGEQSVAVQLHWVGPETDPIQIEVALYYQRLSIKGEIINPQLK